MDWKDERKKILEWLYDHFYKNGPGSIEACTIAKFTGISENKVEAVLEELSGGYIFYTESWAPDTYIINNGWYSRAMERLKFKISEMVDDENEDEQELPIQQSGEKLVEIDPEDWRALIKSGWGLLAQGLWVLLRNVLDKTRAFEENWKWEIIPLVLVADILLATLAIYHYYPVFFHEGIQFVSKHWNSICIILGAVAAAVTIISGMAAFIRFLKKKICQGVGKIPADFTE